MLKSGLEIKRQVQLNFSVWLTVSWITANYQTVTMSFPHEILQHAQNPCMTGIQRLHIMSMMRTQPNSSNERVRFSNMTRCQQCFIDWKKTGPLNWQTKICGHVNVQIFGTPVPNHSWTLKFEAASMSSVWDSPWNGDWKSLQVLDVLRAEAQGKSSILHTFRIWNQFLFSRSMDWFLRENLNRKPSIFPLH